MSSSYLSLHSTEPNQDVELKSPLHSAVEDNNNNSDNNNSPGEDFHVRSGNYDDDPVNRGARRGWYSGLVLDWWFWEIGACVLSFLAIGATIAVLAAYSGDKVPELPEHISLNAIISVLANVAKASILVAVAASISQLKWLWLQDTRSLYDLQIFDDASRGPLGAIHMAFYLRGRHLVSLGALIAVLAMVLEPFMQQLTVYQVEVVYKESDEASVLRTDNVTYMAQGAGDRQMGVFLEQGVMNAIYNGDSTPRMEPSCPTGNCTWPAFHSLGICSRCVDMADKVKLEGACTPGDFLEMEKNCTISFQHGAPVVNAYDGVGAATYISWLLNYTPDHGSYYTAAAPAIEGTYADVQNPLFALGWLEIDYSSLANNTPISRAMECMFTYCLELHNVSVKFGAPVTEIKPTHLASMDKNTGWNVTAPLFPEKANANITFIVDADAGHSVWQSLSQSILGNATTWPPSTDFFIPSNIFIGLSRTVDDKVHMMEIIARSLTDSLLKPRNQKVLGLAGVPEQIIQIRWWWISLPLFVVFVTMLFLYLVMSRTSRAKAKVWKSSALALLYHGLDRPAEGNFAVNSVSEMMHDAARVRARLAASGDDGWKLQQVDRGRYG
ncbi:hypothetical protein AJ79_07199 [Helicocarpus griseus UAMH5409]|uniref:DUF3176 domain containing protein n=1 Tax=Helicocarpus griseus UAMH5409 TaxID=1447875 RepID=A0A2B7X5D0_9EURO|nr:hypothetical protein AJ79_07199 [Helicocarpus griseus UAMH5409]